MGRAKLIWFQHLHKAAGTTIVNVAAHQHIRFYKPNLNANPQYTANDAGYKRNLELYNTTEIRYDRFTPERLNEFIDYTIQRGTEFIGCEWGFPTRFVPHPDVFYLTCIRDPLTRMVSNYNYDKSNFPERYHEVSDWANQSYLYTRDNYYTLIFSGVDDSYQGEVTEDMYIQAFENIRRFNCVLMLEDERCFKKLELVTGWSCHNSIMNRNRSTTKVKITDEESRTFIANNSFDFRLYEAVHHMIQDLPDLSPQQMALYEKSLYGKWWGEKWSYMFHMNRDLDNEGQKEKAMDNYFFILKLTNPQVLATIDSRLVDIVQPYSTIWGDLPTQMNLKWLIEILHHMSYLAYYTSYKEYGKDFCKVLIETPIKNSYSQYARKTLKYY